MKTLNAGIIGTGMIGPIHIEALRRLGFVNVVAIADVNQETADEKAAQLGVPKAYGNYMDLINTPEVDVVHICAPNYLHYEMVKAVLAAKKHVICDKPLGLNEKQSAELTQLAKEAGVVAGINFNIRFYPLMQHVKGMVDSGELGRILSVNGSYQQDWLLKETDYSWRLDTEKNGESRAVADIGSHWMDTIEFVTGLKISKVCADFATFHPMRKRPLKPMETYSSKMLSAEDYENVPVKNEDYATVLLRFDNGAHGSMTVNQTAAGYKNRLFFEIFGTQKGVSFNSERPNELWIGERDSYNGSMLRDPSLMAPAAQAVTNYPGGHNEGYPDSFKQIFKKIYQYILADGIANNLPVDFPTFADGLRESTLCERILESSRSESWKDI